MSCIGYAAQGMAVYTFSLSRIHAPFTQKASSLLLKQVVAMRFKLKVACAFLIFAVVTGAAASPASTTPDLSRAELKRMIENAHSTEDYLTLASYFRSRQQQFEKKAHDELVFWAQRSMNVSLAAAKYPRPEDSSKNRYEYFTYEAQKMSRQAAHFEGLSANAGR